jgi:hemerythrin superfamily protein
MKATDLIRSQHREARFLFKMLLAARSDAQHSFLVMLVRALKEHTAIEEEIFYPMAYGRPELKALIEESLDAHSELKIALADLETAEPGTARFAHTVRGVKRLVDQHMSEEEEELLPKVEALWPSDVNCDVGRKMEMRHDERAATVDSRQ